MLLYMNDPHGILHSSTDSHETDIACKIMVFQRTRVFPEVLLEVVVLAELVVDMLGVGGGVVRDEQEVDHAERDVQDQQRPRELGKLK